MTYEEKIVNLNQYMKNVAHKFYKTEDKVEDAIQDCVYRMLIYKEKYSEASERDLQNLSYAIIKHQFIDKYRVRDRKGSHVNCDISEFINIKNNDHTDSLVMTNEIKERLDKLKAKNRVIMQMLCLGYQYTEIAEQLDMKIGTVKAQIHRIRNIYLLEC